jgi:pre-mRNA-splicing factor SYF1
MPHTHTQNIREKMATTTSSSKPSAAKAGTGAGTSTGSGISTGAKNGGNASAVAAVVVSCVSTLPQDKYYEDEVARNPYHLKAWTSYLTWKKEALPAMRFFIYERALKYLPRSYKLWFAYLMERKKGLRGKSVADKGYDILINTFERALVHMNKMPKIWKEYCELMMATRRGTGCRRVFDRALQSLPITQHAGIWELYAKWVKEFGVKETVVRVFRRYLMFNPNQREEFVLYLENVGHYDEAARQLVTCINDEHFVSPQGFTKHQLWMKLCDICSAHPEDVKDHIKVESVIRSGIAKYSDEVGRLWTKLADFYTRQGLFEKARDIYEEAINSVATVKDFTIVFDSYIKVEEGILTAKMRLLENPESEDESDDDEDGTEKKSEDDIEMRLARIEYLLEKRPILLNGVVLRQNPHNVFEWHKRVKLYKGDNKKQLLTYMEAIKTVDPKLASGKLSGLWIAFAKFYERTKDLGSARTVFQRATQVNFKSVDELASVWCGWGEMELRHQEYQRALQVMQQAVTEPPMSVKKRKARAAAQGKAIDEDVIAVDSSALESNLATADRVHRNVKVWSFYLDLEESLGTLATARAAYDRVFELKVVTPQIALNYADYLEENNYFEDSFRVYEQAVSLFTYPQLKVVWIRYLDKFIARYGGSKLERLRDMFEQALIGVPQDDAAEFYIKYYKAEEQFGMARHALAVLDRATRAVPEARRLDMYRLYAKKVEQHFGITKVRPVLERAIAELSDDQARQLCIEFADIERKLGEVGSVCSLFGCWCAVCLPVLDTVG